MNVFSEPIALSTVRQSRQEEQIDALREVLSTALHDAKRANAEQDARIVAQLRVGELECAAVVWREIAAAYHTIMVTGQNLATCQSAAWYDGHAEAGELRLPPVATYPEEYPEVYTIALPFATMGIEYPTNRDIEEFLYPHR